MTTHGHATTNPEYLEEIVTNAQHSLPAVCVYITFWSNGIQQENYRFYAPMSAYSSDLGVTRSYNWWTGGRGRDGQGGGFPLPLYWYKKIYQELLRLE